MTITTLCNTIICSGQSVGSKQDEVYNFQIHVSVITRVSERHDSACLYDVLN